MRVRVRPILSALILMTITTVTAAATPQKAKDAELERLVDGIQAFYQRVDTFRARFVQVSEVRSLGREERAEGILYYKRPGRMRWEYRGKEAQTIFIDGDTVWMLVEKEKQAYRRKMSEAFRSKTPAAFLSGAGKLRETFRITLEPAEPGSNLRLLKLEPREGEEGLGSFSIQVDTETFQVRETRSRDLLGNLTRIEYHELEVGVELKDAFLTFTAPEGVVVSEPPGMGW